MSTGDFSVSFSLLLPAARTVVLQGSTTVGKAGAATTGQGTGGTRPGEAA